MKIQKKYHIIMVISLILLVFLALLALCMGAYHVSVSDVVHILTGQAAVKKTAVTVIRSIRIPRIMLSMVAGAGLAVSGAAFQSLFANPLATPDTLGTANGASFGAALGILLGFNGTGVQLCALGFGLLAIGLVFLVTRTAAGRENPSILMVVLSGMVISSLFSALVSLVKFAADPNDILPVITFWLMGSFSSATMKSLTIGLPFIIGGIIVIWLLRYRLNVLSLSEEEAASLGVNVRAVRILVIIACAAVTASVVSICGVIGWVGLLVPHIARMLFGNDNRRVVPASIVFGALFMLVTDTIARCATASEIPVSILTAIIGAPVFIILLRKTGGIRI